MVDRRQEIPPGDPREVEIRAATVWGCELLRRALRTSTSTRRSVRSRSTGCSGATPRAAPSAAVPPYPHDLLLSLGGHDRAGQGLGTRLVVRRKLAVQHRRKQPVLTGLIHGPGPRPNSAISSLPSSGLESFSTSSSALMRLDALRAAPRPARRQRCRRSGRRLVTSAADRSSRSSSTSSASRMKRRTAPSVQSSS